MAKKYRTLTAKEEYYKKMRELDKWIKDDMIKNEELIQKFIDNIKKERNV
jgi:DNA-binding phage protein